MIHEDAAAFAAVLPHQGALAGLDFGEKTIGVAVSDLHRSVASPLRTIRRRKFTADAQTLFEILDQRDIGALILGLPRNMDGSEGPRAQSTRSFARNLLDQRGLEIMLWDERLSTVAAERSLLEQDMSRKKRAEIIDNVAAAYILQGFLDRLGHLNGMVS